MAVLLIAPLVALLLSRILPSYADKLALGASLTPSSPPLISAHGAFTLSFRPFAAASSPSSSLYLAISFSSSLDKHPAWVANRDQSVSSSASLSLSSDGSLTLSDSSVVVWSSGTSHLGVVHAQLLDSGNLVLHSISSAILWQSFDYPTDTLLPSQPFGISSNLTAQNRSDSFASGNYYLQFHSTGVVSLSGLRDAERYWNWGESVADASVAQSSFLEYDKYGNFSLYQSGVVYSSFIPTDYGSAATRRLTLDLDGNLRMYSWDEASSRWISVWLAFEDQCMRIPSCGNYGICMLDPEPVCTCPPGFDVIDAAFLSGGCSPTYPPNCTSTSYVSLDSTDFPFNDYQNYTAMAETDCKNTCDADCSCLAYVYWQTGEGHCWLKSEVKSGYSLRSQLFCSFLKVSKLDPSWSTPIINSSAHWSQDSIWQSNETRNGKGNETISNPSSNRKVIIISLAVVIGAQLLVFATVVICLIRRTANAHRYMKLHGDLQRVSGYPITFSYQELQVATDNFSQTLGTGGFGTVFKGQLKNGKMVAVKRLQGLSQRENQFRAEIATLGKIHHINLLRLFGFCAEGDHRLLVYEYMENGSLDGFLFQKSSSNTVLDWATRFQICLDVARGITYLHEECLDCILHCDIKPQNILLDKNYSAKVADFGLAYLFTRAHTVRITSIRGTRGYLAPEWVSNLPITAKADVFSYGMLLFEIVSGRSNYIFTPSAMGKKGKVEEVVDERLGEEVDYEQAEVVLKVAFCCIEADMNARPSMGKVVQMLEGTLAIPEAPLLSLFDYHRQSPHAHANAHAHAHAHAHSHSLSLESLNPSSSSSFMARHSRHAHAHFVSLEESSDPRSSSFMARQSGHAHAHSVSLESSNPSSSSSFMALQLSEKLSSRREIS